LSCSSFRTATEASAGSGEFDSDHTAVQDLKALCFGHFSAFQAFDILSIGKRGIASVSKHHYCGPQLFGGYS